jgi:DNA-binding LacI/PurR family transcriptional regulator
MASRQEVAKLAGVSEATVSRVLNGVGPMKEETRQRVLEAAKRLGYEPSAIAQSFARGKSGNIGVALPYMPKVRIFSSYYFSEILSGIGEAVQAEGYDLLLFFRSPENPADYAQLFQRRKIDACIVLGARDVPAEREPLARLAERELPFAVVGQRFEGLPHIGVDADHVRGSLEAVRHLLALGRSRVAFLNGPPEYSNSRDRLFGYREALAEAASATGAVARELLLSGNYSRSGGRAAAEAVAAAYRRGECDAVFAANDRMAIGLMQGLRELGIAPARDIAIAGYDDSDAASVTDPPLTTVQVPFFEMGRMAAERLIARLQSPGAASSAAVTEPVQIQLPTQLIIRASSGAVV